MPARPEVLASGRLRKRWARVHRALSEILCGAIGADAYGNYLAHQRRHHPGERPLSREAFFRRELEARFGGVRRCC